MIRVCHADRRWLRSSILMKKKSFDFLSTRSSLWRSLWHKSKEYIILLNLYTNWSHCAADVSTLNQWQMTIQSFSSEIWVTSLFSLGTFFIATLSTQSCHSFFPLILRNHLWFRHSPHYWSAHQSVASARCLDRHRTFCSRTTRQNLSVCFVSKFRRCQTFSSTQFYYISKAINYFCNIRSSYMAMDRMRVP